MAINGSRMAKSGAAQRAIERLHQEITEKDRDYRKSSYPHCNVHQKVMPIQNQTVAIKQWQSSSKIKHEASRIKQSQSLNEALNSDLI